MSMIKQNTPDEDSHGSWTCEHVDSHTMGTTAGTWDMLVIRPERVDGLSAAIARSTPSNESLLRHARNPETQPPQSWWNEADEEKARLK